MSQKVPMLKAKLEITIFKKKGMKTTNTRKRPRIEISDSDDTDSDDVFGTVPKDVEEQKLATNPPHIVLINALIQKCLGCNIKFTTPERQQPRDLVFRYLMYRLKPDGNGNMVPDRKRAPAYFHARDLACLCHLEELRKIGMDGIYISNGALITLTSLHTKLLKKCKMWHPLIQTRQQLHNEVIHVNNKWL